MPLTDLLTGHRFALARLQELIVAGSADWADSPVEVAEGLALTNHFSESLIPQMTAAHTGGARRNAETLEINRVAAVRAVLGGGSFDESRLGLRSGRSHIAVAASGPAAERLGAVLRAEDIGPVLVAAPTPQTRWAWCDGRRLRVETLDRLGCWIGVGQPAVGVGGFITSHQQALLALEVALRSGPAATAHYEKVAVQALVWGGQAAADQLAVYALGDLAGRVRRTAKVRETVSEWIECGCSAAESARRLKLSERTVRNHLERAAILRGRPLTDDLPALATALRLTEHASAGD
jgi:hypothetical protein